MHLPVEHDNGGDDTKYDNDTNHSDTTSRHCVTTPVSATVTPTQTSTNCHGYRRTTDRRHGSQLCVIPRQVWMAASVSRWWPLSSVCVTAISTLNRFGRHTTQPALTVSLPNFTSGRVSVCVLMSPSPGTDNNRFTLTDHA